MTRESPRVRRLLAASRIGAAVGMLLAARRGPGDGVVAGLAAYRARFLPAFGAVPLDQLKVSHIHTVFDRIGAENKRIPDARASDDPGAHRTVAGRRETGPTTGCASLTTVTT